MQNPVNGEAGPHRAVWTETEKPKPVPRIAPQGPDKPAPDRNESAFIRAELAGFIYNCGNERLQRGELDASIADFNEAIAQDPNCAQAINRRGVARELRGDFLGASIEYQAALRMDPGLARAWNGRRHLVREAFDTDLCLSYYRASLAAEFTGLEARCNRAIALASQGDLAGAVRDFKLVLFINPKHVRARTELDALCG